jgi:excinuclease UvrABC ATPase subunit
MSALYGSSLPTLLQPDTFRFYPEVKLTEEYQSWITYKTALNIILEIINRKLNQMPKIHNRINMHKIYFLDGRTGSGKSTLLIDRLYQTRMMLYLMNQLIILGKILLIKLDLLKYIQQEKHQLIIAQPNY